MIKRLQHRCILISSGKRTIPSCSSLAKMPCFLSREGAATVDPSPPTSKPASLHPLVPIVLAKRQWPNDNMLFSSSSSGPNTSTHFVSTRGGARRSAESLCHSLTESSAALCWHFRGGRLFEPSVSREVRRLVRT